MAKVRRTKKKREIIGQPVNNLARVLGPNSVPNLSIVCPFCDEDSKVLNVYATYTNLLKDEDMDRVIITPQKIYYPRECIMGHKFWSVECVPDNYEKLLMEIEEIKEFTRQELAEYKDSLEEAQIGYMKTQSAKEKLQRKRAKEEKKKREKEEKRQRKLEEKERIRQAKLDGTWKPKPKEEWPYLEVVKKAEQEGYEVIRKVDPELIRKRNEYLNKDKKKKPYVSEANRRRNAVDDMLRARGIIRKKPVEEN